MPPDFLLAVEPTHHTIRLLWRRPTLASDHVNQSYSIIYWEINDSNTTTNVSINQTVLESSGEIVELILKDLTPGQLYQWRIEARTKIMSILSIVSNFSTLPPGTYNFKTLFSMYSIVFRCNAFFQQFS